MKILVITHSSLVDWNAKKGTNLAESDLSDAQFKEINDYHQGGWNFPSWKAFIEAFNEHPEFSPAPGTHYLRVFDDEPAKPQAVTLDVIFGAEADDMLDEATPEDTVKAIEDGDISGALGHYEFSSEADRTEAVRMLSEATGWDEYNIVNQ